MILVIPLIELRQGKCVEAIRGETGTERQYRDLASNPTQLCTFLREENAKTIFIRDGDSFDTGDSSLNYAAIKDICSRLDIPIQVYSNFMSLESCDELIDAGVYRVVIDNPEIASEAEMRKFMETHTRSRVAFSCICDGGVERRSGGPSENRLRLIKYLGAERVYYYDSDWESDEDVFDSVRISQIASGIGLRFTLIDAVRSPKKLWEINSLQKKFVDSVVLGKSLYENFFPCIKIWRMAEAESFSNNENNNKER
ncbi:MAG: HisA/HisF-related TIM barrel protein [Chloroflexota bacterium]